MDISQSLTLVLDHLNIQMYCPLILVQCVLRRIHRSALPGSCVWRSWPKRLLTADLKPHQSIWQQVKQDQTPILGFVLTHFLLDRWPSVSWLDADWITASHTSLSAVWRTSSSAAPGLVQDARPPPELWRQAGRRRVTGCLHRMCFRCTFSESELVRN